jgi:hypothetical protein
VCENQDEAQRGLTPHKATALATGAGAKVTAAISGKTDILVVRCAARVCLLLQRACGEH